ncbi:MAG: PAS domain S-box protein, partial [Gammaproteobacteria bacterium]|nr:PAS domain S-box protein [Gammaproteobacteria bacterium]
LARNITDRKLAETERLEYQEQLITFMETLPDAVFLKDGEGRWQLTNKLARTLFQLDDYPWQGKTDAELGAERHDFLVAHEECSASDDRAWEAKCISIDNEEVIGPDGSLCTFEVRKMPLFSHDGERKALVIIARDITERNQAEKKLQQLHLEKSIILDNVSVGVAFLKDRTIIWMNQNMLIMFGYEIDEMDEIEGFSTERFYPSADDYRRLGAEAHPIMMQGETYQTERQMRCKDGSLFWCRLSGKAVDPDNLSEGSIWLLEDITNYMLAEEQLRNLSRAVEQSHSTIVITDLDANIEFVNPAFTRSTGYTLEEVLGQNPRILKSGEQDAAFYKEMWDILTAGEQWQGELHNRRKDGSLYWEFAAISPVKDESGKTTHYVAVKENITEHREAEEALKESEERFELAMSVANDGIWDWDLVKDTLVFDTRYYTLAGYEPDEFPSEFKEWEKRVHPHDVRNALFAIEEHFAGWSDAFDIEYRFMRKDGQYMWIRSRAKVVARDEKGAPLRFVGTHSDITEQKMAREQLRLSASVFEHSQEGIIITDANNHIVDVNPATLLITGYSREEVLGENPNMFSSGEQDPEFYTEMWQELSVTGHWQGELKDRKKTGEFFSERLSIDAVRDDAGEVQHYVAVFYDITYLKEHEAALEQIAYNDALTGLPNRLLLRDRMEQALSQAKRQEKLMAVCYLDLDGFKPINDAYGHKAGDQVLIEVAQRLKTAVRADDTVARLGGDEFVLLMLNLDSIGEAEQVLERVLHTIVQPYELPEVISTVSASIGISLYPLDEGEADTLLRHADQAMYVAKQRGKNRYSFFDPSEEKRATNAHAIQHEIEIALSKEQFLLFYQPKVNMRSGEVVGVEALIRWQHPQKGLLLPGEFLPAIEHTSLIIEVGNWVLHQALLQMRIWQSEGVELKVSVNVSALQLQHRDFVSEIEGLLIEFDDVPASNLELEILETAALHDIAHTSQVMAQCIELGVQFSLDDFGTGYSSMSYLKNLPAKVLKIDQSFVCDLIDNPDDLAIIEGILGLARAFQRIPIAEGVESVQHGTLLLNLGCELAQGHGISPPMPAQELLSWIDDFKVSPEWGNAEILQSNADYSVLIMSVEHHRVVSRVLSAIEQRTPSLLPEYYHDHHACDFGQWLDGEGEKLYRDFAEFKILKEKHKQVHKLIELAADLLISEDTELLESVAIELEQTRDEVLSYVNRLRFVDKEEG